MPDSPMSPSKGITKSHAPMNSSTKVIDSLHSKIDELTDELTTLKQSHQELTKKHAVVAKKNDSFVDQLANAKHENDMLSALLKRKERRILDLEDQYNDLNNQIENLLLLNKNMKIRCENLQNNSNASIAEYERLKISYDALIASQMEYRNHYQKELNTLQANFNNYKTENTKRYEELLSSIISNDKDIDTLLDSLTNKRKAMDNIYVNKNNKILLLLTSLAGLIKIHAEDTKGQVEQNVEVISILLEKYPDLQEKILEKEKVEVDLNEVINHSNEALAITLFEDAATLINTPDLDSQFPLNSRVVTPVQNSGSFKKKKNYKRNSLILKDHPTGIPENSVPSSLPKKPQVNNNIINLPKSRSKFNTPPATVRQWSNQSNEFEVTHQWTGNNNNNNNSNNNFSNNSGHYNNHGRTTSYDARSDNGGNRRQYSQGGNYTNNNNNNGFVRRSGSIRNGSNNNNQNNNSNNNNNNINGKQAKRRSTYNLNNNGKRNSQIFDGNFALNV